MPTTTPAAMPPSPLQPALMSAPPSPAASTSAGAIGGHGDGTTPSPPQNQPESKRMSPSRGSSPKETAVPPVLAAVSHDALQDSGTEMSIGEVHDGVVPGVDAPEDGDSAFGDDDGASDYASLSSSAGEYVFENGRRYHGYKAGRYMLPNDETEMDREDIKHHISMLITEGQLHLAPIEPNVQQILDIGTGTGIWAIEMADAYPSAQVVATDLSPIQPAWVPPNLVIEIDDAEEDWLYKSHSIDFIHCRYLFHGIRNWPRLFGQAMRTLKPGGWIEVVELHVIPSSYDNSLPEKSQIMEFYTVLADIGAKIGINLAVAQKFKGMMEDAGFEDVREQVFDLPLGDWMPDHRMKEVGAFQRYQMTEGLHGIAFGLLTRVAGWNPLRVEAFLAGVRKEMKDRNVHSMYKMYFVYGRTPKSI